MIHTHIESRYRKENHVYHTAGISATTAAVLVGGAALSAGGAMAASAMSNSQKSSALGAYNGSAKKAMKGQKKAIGDYEGAMAGINVEAPQVDWLGAAGKALGFNQEHMQEFINMANTQSMAGTQTLLAQQSAADPNFTAKRDQASKNNMAMLAGEIPIDVQGTLNRASAFKGLNTGLGGASGAGRNLRARDFGLTSLDLMQRGDQSTQQWTSLLNNAFVQPAFVSPFKQQMFSGISSEQGIGSAFRQGDLDFRANMANAEIAQTGAGNVLNARLGLGATALGVAGNNYQARAGMADTMANGISSAAGSLGGAMTAMGGASFGGGGMGAQQYAMGSVPQASYAGGGASPFSQSLFNSQSAGNLGYSNNIGLASRRWS